MISKDQIGSMIGATAYTPDGQRAGQVGQVFFDDRSGQPAWATVSTGLFGSRESFVPLEDAQFDGRELHLSVDQDTITHAPNVDPTGKLLSEDEEQELYRFYNMDYKTEPFVPGGTTVSGAEGAPGATLASRTAPSGMSTDTFPATDVGNTGDSEMTTGSVGATASGAATDWSTTTDRGDLTSGQLPSEDSTSSEAVAAYGRGEAGEYERAAGRSDDSVIGSYGRDASSYGREGAASGAAAAASEVDAGTLDRLEEEGAAGEQRFRSRLRRYLADPEMATKPVAEQVNQEDEAVSQGDGPQRYVTEGDGSPSDVSGGDFSQSRLPQGAVSGSDLSQSDVSASDRSLSDLPQSDLSQSDLPQGTVPDRTAFDDDVAEPSTKRGDTTDPLA